MRPGLLLLPILFIASLAMPASADYPMQAEQVAPDVYAIITPTRELPNPQNRGWNSNSAFVVTGDGVLLFDSGSSVDIGRAIRNTIAGVTDQPVRYVILENGQGHAALGSNYWKEQGVPVIAHADAAAEIEEGAHALLTSMQRYNRDKAEGTEVVLPDITFEEEYVIELGGMRIEALYLGPGHSPGDIQVWLPQQKLVISGDMAFHQRLLPIFSNTDTKAWLETYERFLALEPEVVVPGHGGPVPLEKAKKDSYDYLVTLRERTAAFMDEGGDISEIASIDQSDFAYLDNYDTLKGRNAQKVYSELEFE